MKYQEVLEPHRTLLFRLVEIYRERGEASSGLMPFRGVPTGILVYPRTDRLTLEAYSVTSLDVLERRGYLTIFRFTAPSPDQMALRKEALDYYDYSHSPVWRRRISDVWDKTEKHWLSLLFGLLGGFLGGCLAWLSRNWLGLK